MSLMDHLARVASACAQMGAWGPEAQARAYRRKTIDDAVRKLMQPSGYIEGFYGPWLVENNRMPDSVRESILLEYYRLVVYNH